MRLLIFDTETTGLPKSRQPASSGPNIWPHIVSISWVILNDQTNSIEKQKNYIIKPLGWEIPESATKIHGITQEKAESKGVDLSTVLGEFLAEDYEMLVAHNLDFDYNVLYNAIRWDLGLPFNPLSKKMCCTMELSRSICNMKMVFGKPKAPKLKELYEYVFDVCPHETSLHDSMYDVLILAEVIQVCGELRSKMNLRPLGVTPITTNEGKKNEGRILSIDPREGH